MRFLVSIRLLWREQSRLAAHQGTFSNNDDKGPTAMDDIVRVVVVRFMVGWKLGLPVDRRSVHFPPCMSPTPSVGHGQECRRGDAVLIFRACPSNVIFACVIVNACASTKQE